MTVAEYIYNLLSTGYPNRVYFDYFDQSVNLQSDAGVILVRNMSITGDDTKDGQIPDVHTYRIEIIGKPEKKLALLGLSLDVREILVAISTSDIYKVTFDNQFELEQNPAENLLEVTRLIQEYSVYLTNKNTI